MTGQKNPQLDELVQKTAHLPGQTSSVQQNNTRNITASGNDKNNTKNMTANSTPRNNTKNVTVSDRVPSSVLKETHGTGATGNNIVSDGANNTI